MKKNLLLILFTIICLPLSVFAKDKPFYKKFQTSEFKSYEEASYFSKTLELKNNYYTFSEIINLDSQRISLSIKKYDHKGNLIKEDSIINAIIIDAANDDNYIYLFSEVIPSSYFQILKIDADLNTVNSYIFTEDDSDFLEYNNYYLYNYIFRNIDIMNVKNNHVNIFLDDYILQLDLELKSLQKLTTNYFNIENLFPKIYKLEYFSAEVYDSNNNYQVYVENNCQKSRASSCNYTPKFLNNNESVLWSKNFDMYDYDRNTYIYINDVKIVNDYVVVLKTTNAEEDTYTDIIIYNFNGDLVQEINNNGKYTLYSDILPTFLGFKVLKINNESNKCSGGNIPDEVEEDSISPLVELKPCPYMQSEEFYYLYYFIDFKVTGNGKIEYPDKAKAGEQVSFKTQADSNYTVKNVTVKDTNGNTVNVNNGSFIMPEEDVIIEAEFVTLNNPYTKSGLVALLGVIIVSIGSYFVIKKKKLNN